MNTPDSSSQRTLLLIDDEDDLREVLSDLLSASGYRVVTAACGSEGLMRLSESKPDLVILDLMLPDISGFEVCKRMKSMVTGHLPIIILTARGDLESLVDALGDASADDYIVKPFKNRELFARIGACLRVKDLYDIVRGQNEMLSELSMTDDLTGLLNRRALSRHLAESVRRLQEHGGTLACAIFDLDHFKQINDICGHLCGDETLRRFAQLLKTHIEPSMICGRWGGDEFIVLGLDESRDRLAGEALERKWRAWSERIMAAVQREELEKTRTGEMLQNIRAELDPVTLCAGAAVVQGPDPHLNPIKLISDIDALLYQAKKRGGRQFIFAPLNTVGRKIPETRTAESRPDVFILEDDVDICMILRDMLSRQKVTTHIFRTAEALNRALDASPPPAVILLDLRLPDADGMDVCREIRQKPAFNQTKICFFTAFTAEDVRRRAMECGADDFLVKPVTYSRFIDAIQRLLPQPT